MGLGIKLLVIGMLTVFTILSLVIIIGKLLISFTNKLNTTKNTIALEAIKEESTITKRHQSIIAKTIEQLGNGKYQIESIEII